MREKYTSHKYPGKFEGGEGPFTEYLWELTLNSFQDEDTGSDEWRYWVARLGRNLVFLDDRGFVARRRFSSVQEAKDAFEIEDAEYSRWCEDEEEVLT